MSFYGNVYQELGNAFASFIIQLYYNNTDIKEEITAVGTGGSFTFAPGNEWIELSANPKDYTCTIKHAATNAERDGVLIMPFARAEEDDTGEPYDLRSGDIIKIPRFSYDEAGHILDNGEYDLFKLPISETEAGIQDLQDRMVILEEAELEQNADIAEVLGKTENFEQNINDLTERMGEVEQLTPRTETLEKTMQDVQSLLGERDAMTKDEELTVTGIIGNFDEVIEDTKYESISEGLLGLTAMINGTNSSVNNNALATKVALQKLCAALAESGINIDADALWQA